MCNSDVKCAAFIAQIDQDHAQINAELDEIVTTVRDLLTRHDNVDLTMLLASEMSDDVPPIFAQLITAALVRLAQQTPDHG